MLNITAFSLSLSRGTANATSKCQTEVRENTVSKFHFPSFNFYSLLLIDFEVDLTTHCTFHTCTQLCTGIIINIKLVYNQLQISAISFIFSLILIDLHCDTNVTNNNSYLFSNLYLIVQINYVQFKGD